MDQKITLASIFIASNYFSNAIQFKKSLHYSQIIYILTKIFLSWYTSI